MVKAREAIPIKKIAEQLLSKLLGYFLFKLSESLKNSHPQSVRPTLNFFHIAHSTIVSYDGCYRRERTPPTHDPSQVESKSVNIRQARPQDAQALAKVEFEAIQAAYASLLPKDLLQARTLLDYVKQWEQLLSLQNPPVFLCEDNSSICGLVLLGQSQSNTKEAELFAIYVSPSQQRQGIGSSLIRFALQECLQKGYTSLGLWVLNTHTQAQQFYEQLGFEREEAQRSHSLNSTSPPSDSNPESIDIRFSQRIKVEC